MGSTELDLDTAQVTFINNLNKELNVWTQYEQCDKCPYNEESIWLAPNSNESKQFHTYYTLKYAIGQTNDANYLCEDIITAQDQSLLQLVIDQKNGTNVCELSTLYSGRNDNWPLIVASIVLIVLFIAFNIVQSLWNRMKGDDSKDGLNTNLNNKISQRLNSLDAFRGLTMLMMIFVNWGAGGYHFLDHAAWDGIRFADFIFPSFIFIMGVSMAISLHSMVFKKKLPLLKIYKNIIMRSIKLFAVGIILSSSANLKMLRIPGVLQRFSISYLMVASVHVLSLHLNTNKLYGRVSKYTNDLIPYWPDWILGSIMLVLYFTLTFVWEFDPNCPRGYIGPGGLYDNKSHPNCIGGAANKLDRIVFGENHIYRYPTAAELYDPERKFHLIHDPEGLLGTTTSIVLTLIGLQVGKIIRTYDGSKQRLIRWIIWIIILAVLSIIFTTTGWIPINKNLWSFSFICVTGATAIAIFTLFYLLIDHFKVWPYGQPFHYPGMNSIFLYIGHDLTGGMFPFVYVNEYSSHVWPLTQNITGVLLWLLISIHLARKNFFLSL